MTDDTPDLTPTQQLGATLRRLRVEADISGVELARRTGYSQSTISRMERGLLAVTMMAAGRCAWHLGLPRRVRRDLIEEALTASEEVLGLTPIRTILQTGTYALQQRIRLRERNVAQLDIFHNTIVPGLLQTEPYIRMVRGTDGEPSDIERFVRERVSRQQEAGVRSCHILLTEGVFYQGVSDPGVLVDQAEHIARLAVEHHHWRVGVIPRITARPNIVQNGLDLYDGRQAFIGTTAGNALMRDPRPVAEHVAIFAELASLAVYGADAAAILRRIAAEYRGY